MDQSEAGKLGYAKTGHILREQISEKHERLVQAYDANPKYCKQCGEKLPYEKRRHKFCSQSCAAKCNNRGVTRHTTHSSECANCGAKKEHRHNKYCSECSKSRVYNTVQTLEMATHDRTRRKVLLQTRGWACEVCGLSEWMGKPIPIELDHVDGDADNNSAENLRLICPNCHAQTETYKGANAGKGSRRQSKRRQRYADGKTY